MACVLFFVFSLLGVSGSVSGAVLTIGLKKRRNAGWSSCCRRCRRDVGGLRGRRPGFKSS